MRSDGQHFRHVHPQRAADGTWSLPWTWEAAGTYRLYADTTPADADEGVTLTSTVDVAGDVTPTASQPTRTASVDGLDVSVEGDLVPGEESRLTLRVERDGEPVTTIEPYLGAAGHLAALREGDLAYLHVHPEGEAPPPQSPAVPRSTSSPRPRRPGATCSTSTSRSTGRCTRRPSSSTPRQPPRGQHRNPQRLARRHRP